MVTPSTWIAKLMGATTGLVEIADISGSASLHVFFWLVVGDIGLLDVCELLHGFDSGLFDEA